MQIRKLFIRDFGIFNNQSLTEIDSNLVVIGGLNRAGKTTLLEILRYLGYGFPRREDFPPARNSYEVESEVLLENSELYNIQISGYGEPRVNCITGEDSISTIDEIYNNLDKFTYQQLFTLTLDELRRIPEGVKKSESDKLQSILIGAGLSEIIRIPRIEDDFNKRADKIGGKNGTPHVRDFKPYYNQIQEGLDLRNEANSQLEEYTAARQKLEELESNIEKSKNKLENLQYRQDRLDVLKNNYQEYRELIDLEGQLEKPAVEELLASFQGQISGKINSLYDSYYNNYKEYQRLFRDFRREVPGKDNDSIKEKLLKYGDKIKNFYNQLSGIQERVSNYQEKLEQYQERKEELVIRAKEINNSWDREGVFTLISTINTDLLEQGELNRIVIKYNELKEKRNRLQEDIDELKETLKGKKESRDSLERQEPTMSIRNYFLLACGFILAGSGLSFFNIWLGFFTGFAGIGGAIIYGIYKRSIFKTFKNQELELDTEIKDYAERLNYKKEKINNIQNELDDINKKLVKYTSILNLEENVHPEIVRDYVREVRALKKEIASWEEMGNRIEKNKEILLNELKELSRLIDSLGLFNNNDDSKMNFKKRAAKLCSGIKTLNKYRDLAVSLADKENDLTPLEEEIRDLLAIDDKLQGKDLLVEMEDYLKKAENFNRYQEMEDRVENIRFSILNTLKTDRVKRALANYSKKQLKCEEELLATFDSLFKQYTSVEDVNKTYNRCSKKLTELENRLADMKNRKQSLKDKIQNLATSSKLEKAQSKIDENRSELKKLAEEYAVNKAAAFILNRVRKRFMEKTKDTLFDQASKAFSRMTSGEYKKILPPDNLIKPDFQALKNNDIKQETTDVLSRGTKEQLYLAVRLSRIRKIQPPLPVIVDDTLVNFDTYHLAQTLEILMDLSKTHQIFILTCHPGLVEYLIDDNLDIQYWKLDSGSFSETGARELVEFLSYDK